MRILGIETSCDETSAAVVDDGRMVLSCIIASSRTAFRESGGVIPETAARRQVECMLPVLDAALQQAGCTREHIDAIAVTAGPGLLGSLLVGTVTARTLAALWRKPLVPVHHTFGHLCSTWLRDPGAEDSTPLFPMLTLSASGGHTDLWYRTGHTTGMLLGRTRDDAAGEAFDKGASMLGLPYPGGPSVSAAAERGNPLAFPFPRPLHDDPSLDFSFAGLKTALRYLLRDLEIRPEQETVPQRADIAASYQHAICAHLTDRLHRALQRYPDVREIHVVGGVSANTALRSMMCHIACGRTVRFPARLLYCTDNAAMIAAGAEFLFQERNGQSAPWETSATLSLDAFLTTGTQTH